jgi:hypothetical protein
VYCAIAYYLENESAVDEYIAEGEREFQRSVPPLSQQNPELFASLETGRQQIWRMRISIRPSFRVYGLANRRWMCSM